MRILQIAPLWERVPPRAYGGTEAVVHTLVEELVRRGHEVTLCASGDSLTSARLQACYPRSLRQADDLQYKATYSWQHAACSLKEAGGYDLIHNHAGEEVMALSHFAPDVPMLNTMHCLITPDTKFIWDRYDGYYNTISWNQRRNMPELDGGIFAGVVHNAIDVPSFPFDDAKDDYLLYLARISPEKGPHLAVEVARRTGRRLIMAGKVDHLDYNFFVTAVAPLIDGDQVIFAGEADGPAKRALYRKARGLLMPIMWDEPFGLVLAEAQACGTPVVTFRRGAAPEIVLHGRTGFVVEDVEQMAQAVEHLDEIDPAACRAHAEMNFDAPVMAENYLKVYESILNQRVSIPSRQRLPVTSATMNAAPEATSSQVA